jgi:hypothetical protein
MTCHAARPSSKNASEEKGPGKKQGLSTMSAPEEKRALGRTEGHSRTTGCFKTRADVPVVTFGVIAKRRIFVQAEREAVAQDPGHNRPAIVSVVRDSDE